METDFFYQNLAKPGIIPKQGYAQRQTNQVSHNAALNTSSHANHFRKIKLWCNIGPSCKDINTLEKIITLGLDVACVNYKSESLDALPEILRNVRVAEENAVFKSGVHRMIAIALETKGPEIRTGGLEGGLSLKLKKGDTLKLTTDKSYLEKGNGATVYLDYEDILKDVVMDDRILISDGEIPVIVTAIHGSNIICMVERPGFLKSYRTVFIPNVSPNLPSLGKDDKGLLSLAMAENVSYIVAGKVRDAHDVTAIRDYLGKVGEHIQIIAKIEYFQALRNIEKIMGVSDGIMLNRMLIGMEMPPEKVFIAQKNVIARCNVKAIKVVVSREFLTSMATRRLPMHAESIDIANAVMDGADGINITETRTGNFPIKCVEITSKICMEAESAVNEWRKFRELASMLQESSPQHTLAVAAVEAAYKMQAAVIVAFAVTGRMVKFLAGFRPNIPIIAILNNEQIARQLNSTRGVFPILYTDTNDDYTPEEDWQKFIDRRLEYGILHGKINGFIRSGDPIILVHGSSPVAGLTDVMRIIYVSDIVKPIAY